MVLVVSGFSFAKECNDRTLGFSGGRSPTAACGRSHGWNFCRAHNNVFTSILFPVLHKSLGGGKSKKSKKSKNQTDPKAPEKKKKKTPEKQKEKIKQQFLKRFLKRERKKRMGPQQTARKPALPHARLCPWNPPDRCSPCVRCGGGRSPLRPPQPSPPHPTLAVPFPAAKRPRAQRSARSPR